MKDGSDVWLSKAHPPKSFLKTRVASIEKGPLSRSTPPRGMIKSNSLRNSAVSYLTQNSPPPPQLKTARKQSTLNDYFGVKEDKDRQRTVKERASALKGEHLTTTEQEFRWEQPLQAVVEESNGRCVLEKRSFNHNLSNDYIKSAFSKHKVLMEQDLNCYENDPLLQMQPSGTLKKSESTSQSSENRYTTMHCSCYKENIVQDCKVVIPLLLKQDVRTETITCCKELSLEHQNCNTLDNEIRPRTISETDVTFSEGLKFLSQKDTIECDNSESFFMEQNHSLATENGVDLMFTKWEHLDDDSYNRHPKEMKCFDGALEETSSKCGKILSSHLHAESADCDMLDLELDGQTGSQSILSLNTLDEQASMTLEHRDRDRVRMLQDSDSNQGGMIRGSVRMLQDSDGDQGSMIRNGVRMLQDSDRDEVRMLQDSDINQDSIDFTVSYLLDDRLAVPPHRDSPNIGVLQGGQVIDESSSVGQRRNSSVGSQWTAVRNEELERKKQQYMLDIGTIAFTEDL